MTPRKAVKPRKKISAKLATHTSRVVNTRLALGLIYALGVVTAPILATRIGVPRSTAISILRTLEKDGWVVEHDPAPASGRGRPPSEWRINPKRGLVVGVSIQPNRLRGICVNTCGEVLATADLGDWDTKPKPGVVARVIAGRIRRWLQQEKIHEKLGLSAEESLPLRIGIGMAGVIGRNNRQVRLSYSLGLRDFPLAEKLEAEFPGVGVCLHHDAHAAAFAEWLHSEGEAMSLMFCVLNPNFGLGAGFMFSGNMWAGSSGAAGEMPGANAVQQAWLVQATPAVREKFALLKWPAIIDLMRQGDAAACDLHARMVKTIAQQIQNAAMLIDPDRVVLGGDMVERYPSLTEEITAAMTYDNHGTQAPPALVKTSSNPADAVAYGAAMGFALPWVSQLYAYRYADSLQELNDKNGKG
ncbi:hypothetical protein CVU37_09340 [candidate division BRC1 bacterium HGW-BRC1-1]|jgi:glucokinase|nr:MAG: hypothetical protein CVU37_09340 [candidate division BRC1 bacterium HGW-BRC1-1]